MSVDIVGDGQAPIDAFPRGRPSGSEADPTIAPETAKVFLEFAPEQYQDVVGAPDATTLAQASLKLKGSCFVLGLTQLGATLSELEAIAKTGQLDRREERTRTRRRRALAWTRFSVPSSSKPP